jgi:hypothetical protein
MGTVIYDLELALLGALPASGRPLPHEGGGQP